MKTVWKYLISISLIFWSHITGAAEIEFDADVQLHSLSEQKSEDLSAGQTKSLKNNEVLLVKSEGRQPVILLPFNGDQKTKVHMISNEELKCSKETPRVKTEIENLSSSIVLEVFAIQAAIQRKNLDEANQRYQALMQQYPGLAALEFVGASISMIKGENSKALDQVKRGISKHPEYSDGKRLLEVLEKKKGPL
jgi:predicted Zn-dependent protease